MVNTRARNPWEEGHAYLDRDKDGEVCKMLGRRSNGSKFGDLIVKNSSDVDTSTTNNGGKIKLACIGTP